MTGPTVARRTTAALTASTTVVGIIGWALIGGVGVGVIVPNLNLWLSDLISTE